MELASMLILLPPSEGKAHPARGRQLDLRTLADPELTGPREQVIEALTRLCSADPGRARKVLGLPAGLTDLIALNSEIRSAPSAPAAAIYTGVLFAALDFPTLHGAELRRANSRLVIMSGLYGLVRPTDRIASYRLSGDVSLPDLGGLAKFWREPLDPVIRARVGRKLLIDLRSGTYGKMWPLPTDLERKSLTVKIWQTGPNGAMTAVSHHNKAAKGELARLLASCSPEPTTKSAVVELLRANGWDAEITLDHPNRLDVVIDQTW